ncbi:MAG: PorP/SprF family type IX secretion system membrane protein [Bacteroidota bacterium]
MKKIVTYFLSWYSHGMITFLLITCCLVFRAPWSECNAQDIHFSQFWMTPLLLNPANTGSFDANIRAVGNYKDQWRSITSYPYKTFALSLDMKLFKQKWKKSHLGAGINFFSDKAGVSGFGTTQGNLLIAYQTAISDEQAISAGIQGGFAGRGFTYNTDVLLWGSECNDPVSGHDGTIPSNKDNLGFGDFSGGVLWKYRSEAATMSSNDGIIVDAGFAVHHINRPKLSYYGVGDSKLPVKMLGHCTSSIGFKNTNMGIEPGFLYANQGASREIVIGTLVKYWLQERSRFTGLKQETTIALGAHYRVGDALIISALLKAGHYKVGLSYDANLSRLTVASQGRGGFEISVRYVTPIEGGATIRTRL